MNGKKRMKIDDFGGGRCGWWYGRKEGTEKQQRDIKQSILLIRVNLIFVLKRAEIEVENVDFNKSI